MWQISYPPANGASLGSYLVKSALSCKKGANENSSSTQTCKLYFASPEIIEVKIGNRQTDKFFDTIYGCVLIFSSS